MLCRTLSIRAFDAEHMTIDADITDGRSAAPVIEPLLQLPNAAYLHVHFATHGCYAASVRRDLDAR